MYLKTKTSKKQKVSRITGTGAFTFRITNARARLTLRDFTTLISTARRAIFAINVRRALRSRLISTRFYYSGNRRVGISLGLLQSLLQRTFLDNYSLRYKRESSVAKPNDIGDNHRRAII